MNSTISFLSILVIGLAVTLMADEKKSQESISECELSKDPDVINYPEFIESIKKSIPRIDLNCGDPVASSESAFDFIPVVQVQKSSNMEISFCMANFTDKQTGYWRGWESSGRWSPWRLELVSCETGEHIPKTMSGCKIWPGERSIWFVESKEGIICKINLSIRNGVEGKVHNIPPGMYALRVICSLDDQEDSYAKRLVSLGCPPLKFNKTIMIVEVVEDKDTP